MLALFGFQEKKYHPRRTHTKSRAGCLTCKKRRVKCDETRPTCRRCIRTGWSCSWPDSRPSPTQDNNPPLSIPDGIPSRIFQTQRETRFFEFFRLHTVSDLSGWSPSSFWQRLVLQMVHSEPTARRAAIALGAIHLEGEATATALRCYGDALTALRGVLAEEGSAAANVDVCLTSCLLLSCFEIARKDYSAARIHYARGLEILRVYSVNRFGNETSFLDAAVAEDPLHTTFLLLETHIISVLSNRPSPGYVHEPIYTSSTAASASLSSSSVSNVFEALSLSIPAVFPSLTSATDSFLRIQYAIQSASTRATYQLAFAQPVPIPDHEGMYPHRETYGVSMAFPEGLEIILREGLAVLKMWKAAFGGYVMTANAPGTTDDMGGTNEEGSESGICMPDRDERTISLLRGLAAILEIRCSRDPALGEMGYDVFRGLYMTAIEQFERAVELAAEQRSAQGAVSRPLFSLGLGVLHGLYDLVAKCRDRDLRQRGLGVLSKMPFREGLWDGLNARRVNEAIIEFEEQYRIPRIDGPEGISAEHRLVGVNFTFSPGAFRIVADSVQGGRGVCSVELV
ncbi:hypothetical protein BJX64DRAFT_293200 [Aspergillus heterothallicus]